MIHFCYKDKLIVFRGNWKKLVHYHPKITLTEIENGMRQLEQDLRQDQQEFTINDAPVGYFLKYPDYCMSYYGIARKNKWSLTVDEDYLQYRPISLRCGPYYEYLNLCLALTYHLAAIIIQNWYKRYGMKKSKAIKKISKNIIMKKYIAKTLDTLWKPGGKYCEEGYKECRKFLLN